MTARNNGRCPLNERQLELLSCIASGLTIDQAAIKVHLARQSAYNVLSAARSRVNAHTITQLAVMAVEHGWVQKGEGGYTPASRALN